VSGGTAGGAAALWDAVIVASVIVASVMVDMALKR
jgi:hypothetical protein